MTNTELLLAFFSSSLLSAVFGGLIGGWFMLRGKRNDYANDYFKMVLSRRVNAYDEVERLIQQLKTSVLDSDGRPYHSLFYSDDSKQAAYDLLGQSMSNALWLSDEMFGYIRDFNLILYRHGSSETGFTAFGKQHYKEVAELRTKIEEVHLRDMLSLHQIPLFLKNKRPADSYGPVKVQA